MKKKRSAVFESQTNRFGDRCASNPSISLVGEKSGPAPGDYEHHLDWAGRKKRPGNAKLGRVFQSFQSSAPRFTDGVFAGVKFSDGPGPGTYGGHQSFQKKIEKGKPTSFGISSKRFESKEGYCRNPQTPLNVGPGAYRTQGSMLKRSFNITMGAKPLTARAALGSPKTRKKM
jgi:hypothetical protein